MFLSHFNHHQSFYLILQVMWRHQQLRVGGGGYEPPVTLQATVQDMQLHMPSTYSDLVLRVSCAFFHWAPTWWELLQGPLPQARVVLTGDVTGQIEGDTGEHTLPCQCDGVRLKMGYLDLQGGRKVVNASHAPLGSSRQLYLGDTHP